ncbi:MAG: hypothetical protein U0271_46000 [Polyangiaceae bacterium]
MLSTLTLLSASCGSEVISPIGAGGQGGNEATAGAPAQGGGEPFPIWLGGLWQAGSGGVGLGGSGGLGLGGSGGLGLGGVGLGGGDPGGMGGLGGAGIGGGIGGEAGGYGGAGASGGAWTGGGGASAGGGGAGGDGNTGGGGGNVGPPPDPCGNGLVVNEACDDGNIGNGDGCSSECLREPGFACGNSYQKPTHCLRVGTCAAPVDIVPNDVLSWPWTNTGTDSITLTDPSCGPLSAAGIDTVYRIHTTEPHQSISIDNALYKHIDHYPSVRVLRGSCDPSTPCEPVRYERPYNDPTDPGSDSIPGYWFEAPEPDDYYIILEDVPDYGCCNSDTRLGRLLPFGVVGNGVLERAEICEDNNFVDGDGCSSGGQLEHVGETCANAIVVGPTGYHGIFRGIWSAPGGFGAAVSPTSNCGKNNLSAPNSEEGLVFGIEMVAGETATVATSTPCSGGLIRVFQSGTCLQGCLGYLNYSPMSYTSPIDQMVFVTVEVPLWCNMEITITRQ